MNRRGFLKSLLAIAASKAIPASAAEALATNSFSIPDGTIQLFGTPEKYVHVMKVPDGWIECDGRALSRTTYAGMFELFREHGLHMSYGFDSQTFNIPDLRNHKRLIEAASEPWHGGVIGDWPTDDLIHDGH